MGANSMQAAAIALFLLGFTVLSGAIAGGSVSLYLLSAVLVAGSAGIFLRCKPLEHIEK